MQTRSSPNITTLHNLARQVSIPSYDTLSKSDLFQKLKEQFDYERLQRTEKRRSRMEEINVKKRSLTDSLSSSAANSSVSSENEETKKIVKQRLNKIDPIMFTPIKKTKIFKLVRPNGYAVVFNIDTLIDYISKTGDFSDPVTRISLSDEDLKEIDEKAVKLKLQKPSLYELRRDPNAFTEFKFRRDALLGLERCAGEVITEMLKIVETCDPDEAEMRLLLQEFPTFADYFSQLRDADRSYASQCISHWRQYIHGPPNKPNEDDCGLLEIICNFLRACELGQHIDHFSQF